MNGIVKLVSYRKPSEVIAIRYDSLGSEADEHDWVKLKFNLSYDVHEMDSFSAHMQELLDEKASVVVDLTVCPEVGEEVELKHMYVSSLTFVGMACGDGDPPIDMELEFGGFIDPEVVDEIQ